MPAGRVAGRLGFSFAFPILFGRIPLGYFFESGSLLPLFCFYLEESRGLLPGASAFSVNSEPSVNSV
jgi:hypothetical protein